MLNSQLIILDEVHNSLTKARKEIVDFFLEKKDRFIIGFTATDKFSSYRKEGDLISVSELLPSKFFDLSIKEATKIGALSPVKIEEIELPNAINNSKAKDIVSYVCELATITKEKTKGDDSVLIFVPNIKVADELAKKIK